jgi:hypothetical protein
MQAHRKHKERSDEDERTVTTAATNEEETEVSNESTELTITNDLPPDGDGWPQEGEEAAGRAIQGKLLKCGKTGEWTTGTDNVPVPAGIRLVAGRAATAWAL